MNKRLLILVFLISSFESFTQNDTITKFISQKIGKSWEIEHNSENNPFITISKNQNSITLAYISSTTKDVENKILDYLSLASCRPKPGKKFIKHNKYYFYINGFSCWHGYTKKTRKMIQKLFDDKK